MLNIYRTEDGILYEPETFSDGCWIKLTAPTKEEGQRVSDAYHIEFDDIRAALDEE